MEETWLIVFFAGIDTNVGALNRVEPEFLRQLSERAPEIRVRCMIHYPYDDAISGDTWEDIKQVTKNAYHLEGNTVPALTKLIVEQYEGEDKIFLIGYSGGGVIASRVAEQLEGFPISQRVHCVIRVGSPNLHIPWERWGQCTFDLSDPNDPLPGIGIPRANCGAYSFVRTIRGLKNQWWNPLDVHGSYFREEASYTDSFGKTNLTKTVAAILRYF